MTSSDESLRRRVPDLRPVIDAWLCLDADLRVTAAGGAADEQWVGRSVRDVTPLSGPVIISRAESLEDLPVDCPFVMGIEVFDGRLARTPDGYVLAGWDASARVGREQALAHHAAHDPLTGLPNRLGFRNRLDAELLSGSPGVAVALIALSDVQPVNDMAGHQVGDVLLERVANRLRAALPTGASAARLTGDEFALLLTGCASTEEAVAILEPIVDDLYAPVHVGGFHFRVRAAAGVVLVGSRQLDASMLLRYADLALVEARATDQRVVAFDPGMYHAMMRRLSLRSDLAEAVPGGDIQDVYQRVVDLASGSLVGVEALARWTHPVEGDVLPDEFVALAEDTDLIEGIGRLMLHRSCTQLADWGDRGPRWVSVNVSPQQLLGGSRLLGHIEDSLEVSGLDPGRLTVELTERIFIADPEQAAQLLTRIHELGVRVALDDFGTGYSSLSSLAGYPIDVLKLDKSFVDDVATEATQRRMVEAVVALGAALGAQVVAEGIENAAQAALLAELGCGYGQGYYFGRPRPADLVLVEDI